MFGLGIKKPPRLDRFPIETWTVIQGEYEGRPMVARINTGARKYVAHPELAYRLGITVKFLKSNEHGFCSAEEGSQLAEIEDWLTTALVEERAGFPVMVITVNGAREYVFYVMDGVKVSTIVDRIAEESTPHALTHGVTHDPEWSYYKQFA